MQLPPHGGHRVQAISMLLPGPWWGPLRDSATGGGGGGGCVGASVIGAFGFLEGAAPD